MIRLYMTTYVRHEKINTLWKRWEKFFQIDTTMWVYIISIWNSALQIMVRIYFNLMSRFDQIINRLSFTFKFQLFLFQSSRGKCREKTIHRRLYLECINIDVSPFELFMSPCTQFSKQRNELRHVKVIVTNFSLSKIKKN